MRSISPLPHEDEDMVEKICKERAGWLVHEGIWIKALDEYKSAGGNPWKMNPAVFSPDVRTDIKDLYKTRRQSGHIKRIRDYPFTGSCPLCGSLHSGSVDHFLPKELFPEFSIYSLNLIPACPYCNSGEKGLIYKGKAPPSRFLHPYFDKLAEQPIFSVSFCKPYDSVKIKAIPHSDLSGEDLEIVLFHLENILGEEFVKYINNLWTTFPDVIADACNGRLSLIDSNEVRQQAQWLMRVHVKTSGLNSWPTGFYRGMLIDAGVLDYMAQKSTEALLRSKSP